MPYVHELKPEEKIFALFISRSGGGKSTAAASFPKPDFLDFDGRIRSLIMTKHIYKQNVYFEQYMPGEKGWADVDKDITMLKIGAKDKKSLFETVVIDSITTFCWLMIGESLEVQGGRRIKGPKGEEGLRMPGYADYGYESVATKQLVDDLRTASRYMNVIVTAHVIPRYGKPKLRDVKGELVKSKDGSLVDNQLADSEEVGEKIAIRDKIGIDASVCFNEIYRFEKEGNKFCVDFSSNLARSAIGLTGTHDITNINFYEYWQQEVKKINDRVKERPEISKVG